MLTLTRGPSQIVRIGPDVQVVVLDIEGDRVRLGVTAPRDVKIRRYEAPPPHAAAPGGQAVRPNNP
jgi:carbon storage regulator